MAAKEKFDRDDLKEPDQFFETVGKVNRYLEEHRTQATMVAIGLAAALLAGIGGSAYVRNRRENAAAAFARAVGNLDANSLEAARVGFSGVEEAASAGPYAKLARLYAAEIAVTDGNYNAANNDFDAFLATAEEPYLEQAALVGKAYAAEMSGGTDALALYEKAGNISGPYTKQALESALRLADAAGDNASAIKAIERLLELNLPGTDAEDLSRRLESLKAGKA